MIVKKNHSVVGTQTWAIYKYEFNLCFLIVVGKKSWVRYNLTSAFWYKALALQKQATTKRFVHDDNEAVFTQHY